MNWLNSLYCLQFNNYFIFYKQVNTIAAVHLNSTIIYR